MDEFANPALPPESPDGLTPKQSFSRVGWTFAVMLGAATGAQYLLFYLGKLYAPQLLASDWTTWLLSLLPMYLVGLPLGWLILRRLPADAPERHPLDAGHFVMLFVMAFALMYLGNLVGVALNLGIASAKGAIYNNPVYDLLKGTNVWANLVCVVFIAPVMEELVFRKLLCDRVRVYGEGTAILLSGLVFGLFHGNLYQFFYAFAVGLLFAYVYIRTGRVLYSMLLHMCMNFVGGVLPMLVLKNVDLDALSKLSTDDPQQLVNYAEAHLGQMLGFGVYLLTAGLLLIVGIVFLVLRRREILLLPTEKQLPKAGRGGILFGNAGMIVYLILAGAMMAFTAIFT